MTWPWKVGGGGLGRQGAREPSAPQAPACVLAPPPAYFDKLVGIAERIVRHASFPDKHTAVEQCLEEVRDLVAAGRISAAQGAILTGILSGARPQVA